MKAIVWGALVLVSGHALAQGDVVAGTGSTALTQADVAGFVRTLGADNRARIEADPAALDNMVRARLAQKVVLAEAKSKGWDRQPQVQTAIDEAQREVVVRSYLASVSAAPADYPADDDIQRAYDQNKAVFMTPRALHLAQIFVAVPPGADAAVREAARQRAVDLGRKARAAGADFAALASASAAAIPNAQDKPGSVTGGDLGYIAEPLVVPEVRQALATMKPGDVSAPIATASGFHIVRLIDVRAPVLRPLADVKEQVRASLRQQRAQQNAQAYLAKLAGPGAASIDEDALRKALASAQ
ncbi:peptidylprolyl isomerase [Paraburkholderia flava]|uniref:peptidylprolyl isomerase n=1 Tax=Paraburkholderia flava TaxID=2547393 RepID=UPI00105D11C0|nr:peptidylprolyl isomerase [Paraburkholderia flava]